jgi:hypothetical protein
VLINLPEIQVVNRPLLIPHIDVEGEQVQRSHCLATQDLKQRRESIPIVILRREIMVMVMVSHPACGTAENLTICYSVLDPAMRSPTSDEKVSRSRRRCYTLSRGAGNNTPPTRQGSGVAYRFRLRKIFEVVT